MGDRINNLDEVTAQLGNPDDRTVCVDGGILTIGRDDIVHKRPIGPKFPLCHHQIALQALRSRGHFRQLTAGDSVGPNRQNTVSARSRPSGASRAAMKPPKIPTWILCAHASYVLSETDCAALARSHAWPSSPFGGIALRVMRHQIHRFL